MKKPSWAGCVASWGEEAVNSSKARENEASRAGGRAEPADGRPEAPLADDRYWSLAIPRLRAEE